MTTVKATHSRVRLGMFACGMLLLATAAAPVASHAQTSGLTDEQRRQEIFKDAAQGSAQRSQSLSTTTNRQQQLLGYQLRKAKRVNRQAQCRSNGLPKDC